MVVGEFLNSKLGTQSEIFTFSNEISRFYANFAINPGKMFTIIRF